MVSEWRLFIHGHGSKGREMQTIHKIEDHMLMAYVFHVLANTITHKKEVASIQTNTMVMSELTNSKQVQETLGWSNVIPLGGESSMSRQECRELLAVKN